MVVASKMFGKYRPSVKFCLYNQLLTADTQTLIHQNEMEIFCEGGRMKY